MIPIIKPNQQIVDDYFQAIFNHFSTRNLKFKYEQINQWFLTNGSRKTFKEIIIADHDSLIELKRDYYSEDYPDMIKYINKTLYSSYFSNVDKGFGSNKFSAATLTEVLNIKVCPYCNKNYINNIHYSNDNKIKRTCQIDHFHSKDKYPFLAISFFNLIPSCATCNHSKSNQPIGYSPYNSQLTSSEIGKFEFSITSTDYLTNIESINIKFTTHSIFESNRNTFKLEEQYKFYKDIIQEISKKRIMYDYFKINELLSEFEGLFFDEKELHRILYGNVLDEEEFSQKPLSKFSSDIYKLISGE